MELLGTHIRNLRISAGYSPDQFSQLNQLSNTDLLKIERGIMLPSKWCLLQMASKLSIDPHQLFACHHFELTREAIRTSRTDAISKDLKRWSENKAIIRNFTVPNFLEPFIESMIYYESPDQPYESEIILPDGMPQLIINLNNSSFILVGQRDKPVVLPLETSIRQLIVRFLPDALYSMTAIPQSPLLNQVVDATGVFGKSVFHLHEIKSFDKTEHAIVNFFTDFLPVTNKRAVEKKVVRYVVENIDNTITSLVHKSGYSSKHLTHLFKTFVGLTPKTLQQIRQFNACIHEVALLSASGLSGYNWSGNYFDQSHFTHQFRRFSGLTPTAYLKTGNTCPRMFLC